MKPGKRFSPAATGPAHARPQTGHRHRPSNTKNAGPLSSIVVFAILATFAFDGVCLAGGDTAASDTAALRLPIGDDVELELVRLPSAAFMMGASDNDPDAEPDEKPQHPVTISRAFYIGKYEITVGQFRAFVQATGYKTEAERGGGAHVYIDGKLLRPDASWQKPHIPQTDKHPVVCVSWNDCRAFVEWLNVAHAREGTIFRLPTEAEWEYACGGGGERFSFGDKLSWRQANINNLWVGGFRTKSVGRHPANRFGLHDMHGNVWEWVQDAYRRDFYSVSPNVDPSNEHGSKRVIRGGAWHSGSGYCRSARRAARAADFRSTQGGFRIVLAEKTARTDTDKIVTLADGVLLKMARIPAGEFVMGAPPDDPDVHPTETPQHKVRISKDFHMGKFEITVNEFRTFVKATGYKTTAEQANARTALDPENKARPAVTWIKGPQFDRHPVVSVSWHDCKAFAAWLTENYAPKDKVFRLPTEAEWEYACRAGVPTRFYTGRKLSSRYANINGRHQTRPVGSYPANPFGLHDLHGNAWEWTEDAYDDKYYRSSPLVDPLNVSASERGVVRGGGWDGNSGDCRPTRRKGFNRNRSGQLNGFRVVLVEKNSE